MVVTSVLVLSGCGGSTSINVLKAARAVKAAGCEPGKSAGRCFGQYLKACNATAATEGQEHLHAEFCELAILTGQGKAEGENTLAEARRRWHEAGETQTYVEGSHREQEILIEETPQAKRRPNWFKMNRVELEAGERLLHVTF